MSKTEIKYEEFLKYVHKKFESSVTYEDIEELLYLEEGYNKDSPTSLGKSLVLNKLLFSGTKISGEIFKFEQELHKGINVWIADNQKGKSTIFKVVKFALTGIDSIKSDIKNWINEVVLEFNIGTVTYTCYVDRSGRDRGAVYRFGATEFFDLKGNQKLDIVEKDKEFDFKSNTEFQEKMQNFFFEHFSFYTLKYTQKNSAKGSTNLNTANLSWATYFKSIYLESSNYGYLFFEQEKLGHQGKKIFEMILGLPLTYPINMLNVQHDRVLEDIGKLQLIDKAKVKTTKEKNEQLQKRSEEVNTILNELTKKVSVTYDDKPLIEEYNKIYELVNNNRKEERAATDFFQSKTLETIHAEQELKNLLTDKNKLEKEITKLTKQISNIQIYKESEIFFSNLDIKSCPHCEKNISEAKKASELQDHICGLCGEAATDEKTETSEIEEKLLVIKEEKLACEGKMPQLLGTIESQENKVKSLKKAILNSHSKILPISDVDKHISRLKEIEGELEIINASRKELSSLLDNREELIKEQAVINFQLSEIEKENENSISHSPEYIRLNLKKEILDFSIKALEEKRISLNKNILNKLEQLILNEVHAFGLSSIASIKIDDKYNLTFMQHEVAVIFNDLSEGEKLRVKLAFYLSLIQLDIEHNLGRHPRFLIFDSPGSEEMVPKDLNGLSDILKNVNDRFKDKLQIFVGSALREFSEITESKKIIIKGDEEFIF